MVAQYDPILAVAPDSAQQFTLFPIKFPTIYRSYKEALACFWTAEEVDMSRDRSDYEKLSPQEQHFITTILAFFASSDGMVNENLLTNFAEEVVPQEAKLFYAFQTTIEGIHSEVYSLLIDVLISDVQEKERLFDAVTHMPVVAAKAAWMTRYMDRSSNSFAERLIAFSCVEGILFSSSFAAIFFFKKANKMPGLCFSNELISRDEGIHTNFAVLLHGLLQEQCSPERITEIVRGAVDVETEFVKEALSQPLLGMNADSMAQYVQFVADRLLVSLGCERYYKVKNPLAFMEMQSLDGVSNFFEGKVSSYSRAGVLHTEEENSFSLEDDF